MENNILHSLDEDKIKINWNKNPITMERFLSYLTVETKVSTGHLGCGNGWTKRINEDRKLIITGGIVNGVNYLDRIEYGEKMKSKYHNLVNPFYLFDIMNNEGKKFFLDYYSSDIKNRIENLKDNIKSTQEGLKELKSRLKQANSVLSEFDSI